MGKLDGKVALVTGGGSGIGLEIAALFTAEGALTAICGRNGEKLRTAAQRVGGGCLAVAGDIGNEADVLRIFAAVRDAFGRLDILVNNASVVGQVAPIEDMDLRQWDDAMRINLTGTMLCSREAVRMMKAQRSGVIVNVSSNVGRRGFRNRSPYVAAKWAMHGLTQTVALEGGPFGIRCNAICPGPVMTERLEGSIKKQSAARGMTEQEIVEEWSRESPLGRFATTAECAAVALFLAGDDSSAMTGQALNVTAGVVMT